MIFLTLGTQLPFDRLVQAVDKAAAQMDEPVFGQIGAGAYRPTNFEAVDFLTPAEFADRFSSARAIISHAGIGTILSGMKKQKPLLLMARRANLGEHRNDHQLATVSQMKKISGIYLVESAEEILTTLLCDELTPMRAEESPARAKLFANLRKEIFS